MKNYTNRLSICVHPAKIVLHINQSILNRVFFNVAAISPSFFLLDVIRRTRNKTSETSYSRNFVVNHKKYGPRKEKNFARMMQKFYVYFLIFSFFFFL